jgi:hypothetical protein
MKPRQELEQKACYRLTKLRYGLAYLICMNRARVFLTAL